jgi:hypothetical protein
VANIHARKKVKIAANMMIPHCFFVQILGLKKARNVKIQKMKSKAVLD